MQIKYPNPDLNRETWYSSRKIIIHIGQGYRFNFVHTLAVRLFSLGFCAYAMSMRNPVPRF